MRMTGVLAAAMTMAVAPQLALAAATTYVIDPGHTKVHWEARHQNTSSNSGRFNTVSGTVSLDPAAKTGKVEISIDMKSIDTGVDNFDKHLSSADFFAVDQHATATFVGDQISFDGDKISSVTGNLTLLGKTAPVTLTAVRYNCYEHMRTKKPVCGGDFEGSLKRSQWGMDYGLPGIPDEVTLRVQVEAGAQ